MINLSHNPYTILKISDYKDIPKYLDAGLKVTCMSNESYSKFMKYTTDDLQNYLTNFTMTLDDILNKDILNCFYVILPDEYYIGFKKHIYEDANGEQVVLLPKNNYSSDDLFIDDSEIIAYTVVKDNAILVTHNAKENKTEYNTFYSCKLKNFIMTYQKCIPNQDIQTITKEV